MATDGTTPPKRVTTDGTTVEQHDLGSQVDWDKYQNRPGNPDSGTPSSNLPKAPFGLAVTRMRPPGAA